MKDITIDIQANYGREQLEILIDALHHHSATLRTLFGPTALSLLKTCAISCFVGSAIDQSSITSSFAPRYPNFSRSQYHTITSALLKLIEGVARRYRKSRVIRYAYTGAARLAQACGKDRHTILGKDRLLPNESINSLHVQWNPNYKDTTHGPSYIRVQSTPEMRTPPLIRTLEGVWNRGGATRCIYHAILCTFPHAYTKY